MDGGYRAGRSAVTVLERCRRLRRESTDAELRLWRLLRSRRFAGVKFRRQHQYGPFVLDFYCPDRRLAIEADGGQHFKPAVAAKDDARARYLESHGIRVLRLSNLEILRETEGVAEKIRQLLGEPSP